MDIKALRERAGLSRTQVAAWLGVSETSVRNWEKGRTKPTMTPQKYLAALRLFECTPEEFAIATENSIKKRDETQLFKAKRIAQGKPVARSRALRR